MVWVDSVVVDVRFEGLNHMLKQFTALMVRDIRRILLIRIGLFVSGIIGSSKYLPVVVSSPVF